MQVRVAFASEQKKQAKREVPALKENIQGPVQQLKVPAWGCVQESSLAGVKSSFLQEAEGRDAPPWLQVHSPMENKFWSQQDKKIHMTLKVMHFF